MDIRRGIFWLACGGVILLPTSAMRSSTNACSLITAAEAAAAIEEKSATSEPMSPGDLTSCLWSNDPKFSDTSRKVGVNTHSADSYHIAKTSNFAAIKREPIAGLGDDAMYEIYPKGSPFIWVLKGDAAFSIRILTVDKPAPFSMAQEKAKLLVLAKAAVARL